MRKLILIYMMSLLSLTGCAQNHPVNPSFEHLDELLANGQFLDLKNQLQRATRSFGNNPYQYYDAHCYNAFGQYDQSILAANQMLIQYAKSMSEAELLELFYLQARNYYRTYHYKESSDMYATLLSPQFSKNLSEAKRLDLQNIYNISHTLAIANVGKQTVAIHKNHIIPIYHNQFNHMMVPVSSNGKHEHFILDTGASISTISESTAKRLGLQLLDIDVDVATATSINIQTKLGVADNLYIGDILMQNVVFLVASDKDLATPDKEYIIPGIIGFPIIQQLKEIRINLLHNTIEVPQTPSTRDFSNLYMYQDKPVVQVLAQQDTLRMAMDTGARLSELSNTYFKKHKEEIISKSKYQAIYRGGAGGAIKEEIYLYPDFNYQIGHKKGSLPYISVNITDYNFLKGMDGNLGQDVYTQHDQLILNFEGMFMDFE